MVEVACLLMSTVMAAAIMLRVIRAVLAVG